mmetsp:Transcript_28863/g.52803  ORF Transcript_28863/g.52803 Transcript_28863/m.52803 type:complete len:101 (+) Transcript_28863:939-1241(+)
MLLCYVTLGYVTSQRRGCSFCIVILFNQRQTLVQGVFHLSIFISGCCSVDFAAVGRGLGPSGDFPALTLVETMDKGYFIGRQCRQSIELDATVPKLQKSS